MTTRVGVVTVVTTVAFSNGEAWILPVGFGQRQTILVVVVRATAVGAIVAIVAIAFADIAFGTITIGIVGGIICSDVETIVVGVSIISIGSILRCCRDIFIDGGLSFRDLEVLEWDVELVISHLEVGTLQLLGLIGLFGLAPVHDDLEGGLLMRKVSVIKELLECESVEC
jgi:hypothetical protein